jgi:hypothetical protein
MHVARTGFLFFFLTTIDMMHPSGIGAASVALVASVLEQALF